MGRQAQAAWPDELRLDVQQRLERALSRHPADRAHFIQTPTGLLAHAGQGLTPTRWALEVASTEGAHTLVAGDPLLPAMLGVGAGPAQRLGQAAQSDFDALVDLLARARGQFALVHFDVAQGRLLLATDRLGIRPLYYGAHGGVLYVGSSLRTLLAACPDLGEVADLAGQVQRAALGFTLQAHTPYARIHAVEPGRVVVAQGAHRTRHTYAIWADVLAAGAAAVDGDADLDALRDPLHARFVEAVQLRHSTDPDAGPALAYLSGGLDSRCVAAALAQADRPQVGPLDRTPHTINFAPTGSADLALGGMAARALGTQHFEHTTGSLDFWERSVEAVQQWHAAQSAAQGTAAGLVHAKVATGFGGEGALAPTNITASMLIALRAGRTDEAIDEYLRRFSHGLPTRLLCAPWRQRLPALLRSSLRAALLACPGAEPGQQFHVLLLLNELRGHVARHFEDLDLRRIEWTLPFADTEVVRAVLRIPIDALLQHRFYYRWLEAFGPAVSNVAWQAYPTSLPCPWRLPPGLRNQWAEGWLDRQQQTESARRLAREVGRQLEQPDFPAAVLDRRFAWLMVQLARLGIRRYTYYLRAVDTFAQQAARIYR